MRLPLKNESSIWAHCRAAAAEDVVRETPTCTLYRGSTIKTVGLERQREN
jgi:hypothetical protein